MSSGVRRTFARISGVIGSNRDVLLRGWFIVKGSRFVRNLVVGISVVLYVWGREWVPLVWEIWFWVWIGIGGVFRERLIENGLSGRLVKWRRGGLKWVLLRLAVCSVLWISDRRMSELIVAGNQSGRIICGRVESIMFKRLRGGLSLMSWWAVKNC